MHLFSPEQTFICPPFVPVPIHSVAILYKSTTEGPPPASLVRQNNAGAAAAALTYVLLLLLLLLSLPLHAHCYKLRVWRGETKVVWR